MHKITKIISYIIIKIIEIYSYFISPFLGAKCRFYPSCSSYTKDAFLSYGLLKGCYLSLKRILKCHPFSKHSGYDPVKKQEN